MSLSSILSFGLPSEMHFGIIISLPIWEKPASRPCSRPLNA